MTHKLGKLYLIALLASGLFGCRKKPTPAPVPHQIAAIGDTNEYYRKLDWDHYTNLCVMWLDVGHTAGSFGVPLNLIRSNAIHILEKNRYP